MKKIAFALIAVLTLLGSCKIEKVSDQGPEVTRTISLDQFRALEISVSTDIEYIPSDTFSVTVTAGEKVFDRLSFDVADSVLRISNKKNKGDVIWIMRNDCFDVKKIVVRAPLLTSVSISGSGTFESHNTLRAQQLTLAIAGSGEMNIDNIAADKVETNIAGSGEINIDNIEASTFKTSIAGSGEMAAGLTRVATIDAEIAGSGECTMKLRDCGSVTAFINGSGDMTLTGNAQSLSPSIAGSGNINTDNLKLTK